MEGKGQRDPVNPTRLGQSKETVPWLSAVGVPTRAPPFPPGGPPQASSLTKPPVQDPPPKNAQWKDKLAGTTQQCRKARTLPKHPPSHPGASGPFSGGAETAAGAPRRLGRAGPDQAGRTGPQSWAPEARARRTHPGRPTRRRRKGGLGPRGRVWGCPRPGRRRAREAGPRLGEGERARRGIGGGGPAQASGRRGGRGPAPRGTGGAPGAPRPGARQEGRG